MKKINERTAAWKRLFTEDQEDINEGSSWKDILVALNLGQTEFKIFLEAAIDEIGSCTDEEKKYLSSQPYYDYVVDYLSSTTQFNSYYWAEFGNGDCLSISRYPEAWDGVDDSWKSPQIIEVTICAKEASFEGEVYLCFYNAEHDFLQHGIIRYVKEMPFEFVAVHEAMTHPEYWN